MSNKTPKQEAHALITYFLKKYKSLYGTNPPGLNRYTLTFGFEGLYLDYEDEARALIDYYFDSYVNHSPKYFIGKYGEIAEEKIEDEKDAIERERIYRETIKRVKKKREGSE